MAASTTESTGPKVEIAAASAEKAEHTNLRARYVTAATFDASRLVFGDFESKPVKNGDPGATSDGFSIKYRYSDDPSDTGSLLKWQSPLQVSPRGFSTRLIQGKTDWSYMVVYTPNDDPDWDEDTLSTTSVPFSSSCSWPGFVV